MIHAPYHPHQLRRDMKNASRASAIVVMPSITAAINAMIAISTGAQPFLD